MVASPQALGGQQQAHGNSSLLTGASLKATCTSMPCTQVLKLVRPQLHSFSFIWSGMEAALACLADLASASLASLAPEDFEGVPDPGILLGELARCPQLAALKFAGALSCSSLGNPMTIRLPHLRQLTSLELSGFKFKVKSLLSGLPNLTALSIPWTALWGPLAPLSGLTALRSLSIAAHDGGKVVDFPPSLPGLQSLCVRGFHAFKVLTLDGLTSLSALTLEDMDNLVVLSLKDVQGLQDVTLAVYQLNNLCNNLYNASSPLTRLVLRYPDGSNSVGLPMALTCFTLLQSLKISFENPVGDGGVLLPRDFGRLSCLTSLDLGGCDLDELHVSVLTDLLRLKLLDVSRSQTDRWKRKHFVELSDALPDLHLITRKGRF